MTKSDIEILLVEDNPYDAELSLRAIKTNHVANKITHVKNGEQAIDFIFCQGMFSSRIDTNNTLIVLLDLKLPKISGLEVLKKIRTNPETKSIAVVILTSSKEESDLVESYNLGVNSYIVKPVDFEQFLELIKHLGYYWLVLNQYPTK